jgi:S1-C subfamily serine protease
VAGCDKVTVELPEGSVAAEVVDSDRILDLAVLRTASHPAAHARIRQQSAVLGESVYLFGYPQRGLLQSINMTNGIVSSMTGFKGDEGELQTSAATQPGNSGGPLVDSTGAVIGVISSILRNSQNVSFAIKNTLLVEYLNAQGVPLATSNVQTVSVTDIAKEAQGFTYPVACHLLRDEKK